MRARKRIIQLSYFLIKSQLQMFDSSSRMNPISVVIPDSNHGDALDSFEFERHSRLSSFGKLGQPCVQVIWSVVISVDDVFQFGAGIEHAFSEIVGSDGAHFDNLALSIPDFEAV